MHIKKVQITPAWTFKDEQGRQLEPQLFQLLHAIHAHGKLTAAAKEAGVSYRHAWNLLNKWTEFFGVPLALLEKGRGASLTSLGEKLLWAEQRISARLEPQLKNLASELNLEIQRTLADENPVLRLHASHGYAVALLPEHAKNFQLDLQYMSTEEALSSFSRGQCDIAGFHLPTQHLSDDLYRAYSRYIKPDQHQVLSFITRQQGLMVAPGNPKGVTGVEHLAASGNRFINRQKNSGTRALLDELLRRARVPVEQIVGFDSEEFTHSAIAAHIAAGMADIGFGVQAAAAKFGLDFIPIEKENYLLVCRKDALLSVAMERFQSMLACDEFSGALKDLPGYNGDTCGKPVCLTEYLPFIK